MLKDQIIQDRTGEVQSTQWGGERSTHTIGPLVSDADLPCRYCDSFSFKRCFATQVREQEKQLFSQAPIIDDEA